MTGLHRILLLLLQTYFMADLQTNIQEAYEKLPKTWKMFGYFLKIGKYSSYCIFKLISTGFWAETPCLWFFEEYSKIFKQVPWAAWAIFTGGNLK